MIIENDFISDFVVVVDVIFIKLRLISLEY